jgi:hypothetical protein
MAPGGHQRLTAPLGQSPYFIQAVEQVKFSGIGALRGAHSRLRSDERIEVMPWTPPRSNGCSATYVTAP